MKEKSLLLAVLFMVMCSWSYHVYAQVTGQQGQSRKNQKLENTVDNQENFLSRLEQKLSQMTEEEKTYARANWLVAPAKYPDNTNHPLSFMISPNPAPDTQTTFECAGCSSAYLLRFYGEDFNGVELYHQASFPCKHEMGAFPRCFKVLFEEQHKDYSTAYYTGTTDDLKSAISQGVPVIVLLSNGKSLHYVPVVGYDEANFYIQDSVDKYRNVRNNKACNRSIDINTFDTMWNIPIESCQRLFVVIRKINGNK